MSRSNPLYYIAPSNINITPNANGSVSDLAVSITRGAVIRIYDPRISALGLWDSSFQEWTLTGRNRRLGNAVVPYTIYARLRKATTAEDRATAHTDAYLVFAAQTPNEETGEYEDPYVLSPNTSSSGGTRGTGSDGQQYTWQPIPARQAENGRTDYWWVKLGTVSAPDESGQRTVDLDTGILGTEQYNAEWQLNPDELPLRVQLTNSQNSDVPFLRWGESVTLNFLLLKGWTATEQPGSWSVTRNSGDVDADAAWNSAHQNVGSSIIISHSTVTDDIPVYAAVFNVQAYDGKGDPLASAAITIMAETAIEYSLIPSVTSVIYHPEAKAYTPSSFVTFQILAKNMDGSEEYLTHEDIERLEAVVRIGTVRVAEYSDSGAYRVGVTSWTDTEGVTLDLYIDSQKASSVTVPRISDGESGPEGTGYENIFCRTVSAGGTDEEPVFNGTLPADISTGTVDGAETAYADTVDTWVPDEWSASPLTPSAAAPYVWVAKRQKTGGRWAPFSTPALYSRYSSPSVVMDLDNQLDAIARNSNGESAFARTITAHARLYQGGQTIQSGVTYAGDYGLKDDNGRYLVDSQGYRIRARTTNSYGTLTLTWTIPAGVSCPSAVYSSRITATFNGRGYEAMFRLNVLREGTVPAICQLYPSVDALTFTNVNGALVPDSQTVYCGYSCIDADGITNYPGNVLPNLATSASDGTPTGQTYTAPYNIFYRLLGQTTAGSWLWARAAASSGSTPDGTIAISKEQKVGGEMVSAVEFVLSSATSTSGITDGNIIDREKIPVLRDGLDGDDAVTYFIQSSIRSVKIPAGSEETTFSADLAFYRRVGKTAAALHTCYAAAWWRGDGEEERITDASVFPSSTTLNSRAKITNLSTAMNTSGCVTVRADAVIVRMFAEPPTAASVSLAELEIPIFKDGNNGADADIYSITSNVQSVVIPANLTATTFSASVAFWKKTGTATKVAYSCYTTAFWRRGTTYTRISSTGYYPSYSAKRTTAAISDLSTNNSSALRADAIVIRMYDAATSLSSTKFLAELEIPVLKDGDDGVGVPGETGKSYYYLGEWTDETNDNYIASDATFDVTKHVAPYVSVTVDDTTTFWMLVAEEGTYDRTTAGVPSADNSNWELMTTEFKYLISQAIFSDFAKLGSAIFNKDWMFSQYGLTGLGQTDTNAYQNFDRNFYNLEHSNKLYGHHYITTGTGPKTLGQVELTAGVQYTIAISSRRYARSGSLVVYYGATAVQGAKVTTPTSATSAEFVETTAVFTAQHTGTHTLRLELDNNTPYTPATGYPRTVTGSSTTAQYAHHFWCVGYTGVPYKLDITGRISSAEAKLMVRVIDPNNNAQLGNVIEFTTTSDVTKSITFTPTADRSVSVQVAVVKKSSSYTGTYTGTVTKLSVSGITDYEWSGLFANFIPKVAIDWSNGYAHFCGNRVQFNPDGGGFLAGGNIRWDANGVGLITNAYQRNNFSFITSADDFAKYTSTKKAWLKFSEATDEPTRDILAATPVLDIDNLGQLIAIKYWERDNAVIHLPFIAAFGTEVTGFDYFFTGATSETEFSQLTVDEMVNLRRAKMRARAMLGRSIEIYNLSDDTVYLIGVYNKFLIANNEVDMTSADQDQVTERYALTKNRMLHLTCKRCQQRGIVEYNQTTPEIIYWDVESGATGLNPDDFAPEYLIDM